MRLRIVSIFLFLLFCSCAGSNIVLSPDNVVINNQQFDFIAGERRLAVVMYKILYNPQTKDYSMLGWVDDVNWNDNDNVRFQIYKLNRSTNDSMWYGTTGKFGKFKLSGRRSLDEEFVIIGEQNKYIKFQLKPE